MLVIGINMNDLLISVTRVAFLGGNCQISVKNGAYLHKLFIGDSRNIDLIVWMAGFRHLRSRLFCSEELFCGAPRC